MLDIRELCAGYGTSDVLRSVSLTVARGEIVALVGANGSGKSTLLKAISGLIPATRGTIALDGAALNGQSAATRVRLGIAHVPEGRQIFSELTVGENARLGAFAQRHTLDEPEIERRLARVFELFPALRERRDTPGGELSGGQQQMLAIGRGLVSQPVLLLLDEPSLGLAPILVEEIFRILVKLRAAGSSILLAEQNARMSLAIADRGYVIENGAIAARGTGRELLESPTVVERYLGLGVNQSRAADQPATVRLAERLAAVIGKR
ncbi:MAG: ABC transporter ATP-binding protein [Vulcanimicrobiaceae bacterium]